MNAGPLRPADLARAREYVKGGDKCTVQTSNEWIVALLDDIEARGIDELRQQQAEARGEKIDARSAAIQFMNSAGESDTTDQAHATATGALAWATLAVADELAALRAERYDPAFTIVSPGTDLPTPPGGIRKMAGYLPQTAEDRADFADRETWVRLDPDDGRRWKWDEVSDTWELMNRRTDGGEDGPAFSSPDWMREQGNVIRIPRGL